MNHKAMFLARLVTRVQALMSHRLEPKGCESWIFISYINIMMCGTALWPASREGGFKVGKDNARDSFG